MEYLMTYGWAILIIAVVLGALFQLGVFNSSSFSPRAPPGACQVFRPSGPGTVTNINLMGVCTGQLPQYVAQFPGSASSNIIVQDSNIFTSASSGTLAVWFSPSVAITPADPSSHEFISKNTLVVGIDTANSDGRIEVRGPSPRPATSQSTWNVQWYQATVTWGSSGYVLYINGQSAGTSIDTFAFLSPSGSLVFGKTWKGNLANAQVYNTSLSANQVQALYLEGIGGAPMKLQNLAGWWPLNGNANDYSGNNNNGVPTAVTFTSQYGK